MSPEKQVRLKNYMEDIVWSFLPKVLAQYPNICQCELCRHDIVALALNQLPPRYVSRELGEIYTKVNILESQHRADVYAALTKAIAVVENNPRHKKN
ncbi:MAG: late competence development ComFB family protein [Bacillota bacterium]